jgi:mono/diheme cytochrome c family protein
MLTDRLTVPVALATAALLLTECGSSPSGATSGSKVFAQACAACHSLIGNESRHRQGGDLLGYRISRPAMTEFVREMPVRHQLTAAQLAAVVGFVERAELHARR